MAKLNENFFNLKKNYLFIDIAKRIKAYTAEHPDAKLICLTAFCGCHPDEVHQLVDEFNWAYNDDVFFVDATLWVPLEPLHPLTDGHKIIADRLIPILKERYNL